MKLLKHILSESTFLLLLEYDREKTMKNHIDKAHAVAMNRVKNGEHDPYLSDIDMIHHGLVRDDSRYKGPDGAKHELMDQFEESDPTPNKKYVQHIARIYGNGGVNRHEDIYSRMKPALRKYDDMAKRKILPPEHRDIGRFKSLSDLEDVIDAHSDKLSNKQEDAAHHEKMKSEATITDHPSFTHIIPHSVESAAHFGKGTRWCTATDNPSDSMFRFYNSQGPLQIYVPKNTSKPGEKFQYHYSTDQLMDPRDSPVDIDGGELWEHPDIANHIKQYKNDADKAHEDISSLDHPEFKVRNKARAKHWDSMTQDHIDNMVKKGDVLDQYSDEHYDDLARDNGDEYHALQDHPLFNGDNIHHILDHYTNQQVKTDMMNHPKADESHFDKVINGLNAKKNDEVEDPLEYETYDAAYMNTANKEHHQHMANQITSNDSKHHIYNLVRNRHVTPDLLHDTLVKTKDPRVKEHMIGHLWHSRERDDDFADLHDKTLKHMANNTTNSMLRRDVEGHLEQRKKKAEAKKAKSLRNIINRNPTID